MTFKSFVRSIAVASGLTVATAGSALPLISLPANAYAQQVQNPTGGNMGGRVALSSGDQFADEYQRIVGRINGRREISYNDVITFLNGILEKVHSNRDLNDNELSALSRLRNPRNLDNDQKMALRGLLVEVRNGIFDDYASAGTHLLALANGLVTPVRRTRQSGPVGPETSDVELYINTLPVFPVTSMRRAAYGYVSATRQERCVTESPPFNDFDYYFGGTNTNEVAREVATLYHGRGCENLSDHDRRIRGQWLADRFRQAEAGGSTVLASDLARNHHTSREFYDLINQGKVEEAFALLPNDSPLRDWQFNTVNQSEITDMQRGTGHIVFSGVRVGIRFLGDEQTRARWSSGEETSAHILARNLHVLWEYAELPHTAVDLRGPRGAEVPVPGTRRSRSPSLLGSRGTLGAEFTGSYLSRGELGMDVVVRGDEVGESIWASPIARSGRDEPTSGIPIGSRGRRSFFTLELGGGLSSERPEAEGTAVVPRNVLGLNALLGVRVEGRNFDVALHALGDLEWRRFLQGEIRRDEAEGRYELRVNPRWKLNPSAESSFVLYAIGDYSYDTLLRQIAGPGAGGMYGGEIGAMFTYHGVIEPAQLGLSYHRFLQGADRPLPTYSIGVNLRVTMPGL